jgi:peptidoglycan/xylan/chitin deacetylase (PgdA/CDA1 family)
MWLRVPRSHFVDQMTLLRDEGYNVVPLRSLLDTDGDDEGVRIAITFDDGYESQLWAAEVLRTFGFPATFFIVPRFLDGVRVPTRYWEGWGHMRWEDVAALAEQGFDVGAHSTTHPDLTKCGGTQLDEEVSGARALLERRLARPILNFSYPHGRHDSRVRGAVERAGYRLACTSRYGINRTSSPSFAVYRTEVSGHDDLLTFRSKLHGKYDWLGYWQDLESWRYRAVPSS